MPEHAVRERARRRLGTGWWRALERAEESGGGAGDDAGREAPDARPEHDAGREAPDARPEEDRAPVADVGVGAAAAAADPAPDVDPRIEQRRLTVRAEHNRRRLRACGRA